MKRTDTVIIGGGQAGLAMSRCLADQSIDHVVLERGRVAERWRSERWNSLCLLTPNWQSRLPGYSYQGSDPDGYMSKDQLVDYLEGYARSFSAPVLSGTTVLAVERLPNLDYRVDTDAASFRAPTVVIATGHSDRPHVPDFSHALHPSIEHILPTRYRSPRDLPPGGVLVVGASATGVQLALEARRSGKDVTLAVGRHTRAPRHYRGRDLMWWLDQSGIFDEAPKRDKNLQAARKAPSFQLIGSGTKPAPSVDLNALQAHGVRLVGRALSAQGTQLTLADNLADSARDADTKLNRLLQRIDRFIETSRLKSSVPPPEPLPPTHAPSAPTALDLRRAGIRSVIWATGFYRSYPWLKVPVFDPAGDIAHDRGVTPSPGLYALGFNFLRRRSSSFIDGVGKDARELSLHLAAYLSGPNSQAA